MRRNKELAFVGLGLTGTAVCEHLAKDGFAIHAYDISPEARDRASEQGIEVYDTLEDAITALSSPRTVWMMVPSRNVDEVTELLKEQLSSGDCIIDGGNSFFKDSVFRHHDLDGKGIDFIDCGVSGGVEELQFGASLMVGGEDDAVKSHEHIFRALAEEDGYGHVGGPGAGHFVKMVHNGIEYGMMGAIAEGMNVLHEHKEGMRLRIPEAIKAYEHGSIIESNLISWLADAYEKTGKLEKVAEKVPKYETEMEMEYLVSHNKLRVLTAAITQRKLTRVEPSFTGTLIRAMRNEFSERPTSSNKQKVSAPKKNKSN